MLVSIKISNLALIEKSHIEFDEGFNVLTGETGAGKSLIVDALLFLTGIRADKTLIKAGQESARVEGMFSVSTDDVQVTEILNSVGLENDGQILISRQFNINGKNECRLNGEMVTLNIIRKLSAVIIDIFGQNDSQALLDSNNHIRLLDELIEDNLSDEKKELHKLLSELSLINTSIKELGGLDSDRINNLQLLEFQIKEIDEANLVDGEEEDLKNKISTMQNSEKIYSALDYATSAIDNDYSVENMIKTSINHLSSIENFDSEITSLKDRLYSIRYEVQDILSEISSKRDNITFDEEELEMCQDRLMLIRDLERKYGATIAGILEYRQDIGRKFEKLNNADAELERLKLNKNNVLRQIFDSCSRLREIRKAEIIKLRERLIIELQQLGMNSANFEVGFINDLSLDNIESVVNENGADNIEFLFSANLGVAPRPLSKIISGGEMSRFMLAFKTLQNADGNKTCIFDEIDTGIGGEVGKIVGQKICKISRNSQVICITHLAQIASFGDVNFKIEKTEDDVSTKTSVSRLTADEKCIEIARMLGSKNETSINHAKEIIDESNAFKLFISK
ncbi:MAG: DNA repair protein RecN [Clostridia bacterium]|nr:DNA repair protein RecN [Clostridia bacterium]